MCADLLLSLNHWIVTQMRPYWPPWSLIYQTACKSRRKFHLRRKGKTCVRPKYIHSFQIYQTLRTHGCTLFPVINHTGPRKVWMWVNTPRFPLSARSNITIWSMQISTCILSSHVLSGILWSDVSVRRWTQQTERAWKKLNFCRSEIHSNINISQKMILHWYRLHFVISIEGMLTFSFVSLPLLVYWCARLQQPKHQHVCCYQVLLQRF